MRKHKVKMDLHQALLTSGSYFQIVDGELQVAERPKPEEVLKNKRGFAKILALLLLPVSDLCHLLLKELNCLNH